MKFLTVTMLTVQKSGAATQDYLWLAITLIALVALVVSITNAFRISQIKKMLEANLANQKEDMDLSFKKIKSSLGRDISNIKREVRSGSNKPQQAKQQNAKGPKVEQKQENGEGEAPKKKPARKPQRRKYPPRKPKGENKPQQDNSAKE